MNIHILSARTGNGHISVAKALSDGLKDFENFNVIVIPDFYENLSLYTTMMSNFYNLLQARSNSLCKEFTELACLESAKTQNDVYNLIKENLEEYFNENNIDVIISVAPVINRYLIKFIKENDLCVKYYVVVTDPFLPMYPGFDIPGADCYFCPNISIYNYLGSKGIADIHRVLSGYPIKREFLSPTRKLKCVSKFENLNVLINCGANGNIQYIRIIESLLPIVVKYGIKIFFLCGKNDVLYKIAMKKFRKNKQITIMLYEDRMESLLSQMSLCITKPGANTVFECISMKVPILINAIDGLLYQESGIKTFIFENPIGEIANSLEELNEKFTKMILSINEYNKFLEKFHLINGIDRVLGRLHDDLIQI